MKLDSTIAAIVTGGASGLGEATARQLAASGAKVAILDMQRERGAAVAREIGGLFCEADVTNEPSIDAALASAAGGPWRRARPRLLRGRRPGEANGLEEARHRRTRRA